ncbi:MAG: ABC transporter ATP-binding protein [Clostridia bacterium]|nr:ABC transporter ATP-binding protein [Clostridia bacterium]
MMKKNTALKWDIKLAKQVRFGIALLSLLGILYSILNTAFALVSKEVIDAAADAASGKISDNLVKLCIWPAFLIVLQLVFQIVISKVSVKTSGKIVIKCKKQLFSALLHKEAASVLKYHSGELLNRLTSDVAVVSGAISSIIPDLVHYITSAMASFIVLFALDKTLAVLCLLALPVVFFASRIYRNKMKFFHKRVQESDGKTRSFMQETLSNILVVKSFGSEEKVVDFATDLQTDNFKLNLKRNDISIMSNLIFFIAMTAGYYFAMAWGALRMANGLMSFGTLMAVLQLVEQLQSPFRSLSSIMPQYYAMTASTERIMELENLPEEEMPDADFDRDKIYDKASAFCVENLTFSYEDKLVLDNVSFRIEKGEFAAVTGLSGAGKSTLLKLFLGIIEADSGEIYLLDENGEKLSLDAKTRALFAYVPQGNLILSGTIRENIAFAKSDATDEEIIYAAKMAEIWNEISALPDGLDTVLGESGTGLSEGQIQRLAIARALLYDAPVLLLDECTSALDEKTEKAVLDNLISLKSKTCLTVSHKAAAKQCCNVNLFVENGVVYKLEKN